MQVYQECLHGTIAQGNSGYQRTKSMEEKQEMKKTR